MPQPMSMNNQSDANSAHGYEPEGDVKSASEQQTVDEQVDQADFDEVQEGDPRLRDAELTLEQRMARNHADSHRHNK
mgnify:CR=1 FL=1